MQANQKALRGLPEHVIENHPRFVDFVSAFYEWEARNDFLTREELENLSAMNELFPTSVSGQAYRSDIRWRERNLDRQFAFFETSDGSFIECSDTALLQTEITLPTVPMWYGQFGEFQKVGIGYIKSVETLLDSTMAGFKTLDNLIFKVKSANTFTDFRDIDDPRMIKLLRVLYSMKGTRSMINLFFGMYFGETVTVVNTKDSISKIDDNFVLDDNTNRMRDDVRYSEYTYIVKVSRDVEVYQTLFEQIYKKHFHPAGFNVILERG